MTAKQTVIILGGGGHAKVLIDAIRSGGLYTIKGIVDPSLAVGTKVSGVPVLGDDRFLERCGRSAGAICLAIGVGSVKAPERRKAIFERFSRRFRFPAVVHENAYVASGVTAQEGVQVMAGAVVNPDAEIGKNCVINTSAVVEHDCIIGAHAHISIGAVLGGGVTIGECSHIGMGAKILQGVRIGSGVTVGAGAVVVKDVGDGMTVAGVPARSIRG